jgi:16S rRNA (uracil1498-N3)-methyltransferase
MRRRRFFVPQESIRDGIAHLPADQTHHLKNVLRLRTGDAVEIFDGTGNGYTGEVEFRDSGVLIRKLSGISRTESTVRVILAAALVKPAKYEWILQKATELGVQEIIPLGTKRSDIEIPSSKIADRLKRWNRIVVEASKQCRRSFSPRIHEPRSLPEFLAMTDLCGYRRFMLYEKASEPWRLDSAALSEGIVLCIGPEGGWDDGEVEMAKAAGCEVFSLGPRILRAETAAIASLAIVQHHINLLIPKPGL